MNSSMELLEELARNGIRLLAQGDKLRAKGRLSEQLKERIRNHKTALMQLVRHASGGFQGEWEFELLKIPSQRVSGFVDIWVTGVRLDQPGMIACLCCGSRAAALDQERPQP